MIRMIRVDSEKRLARPPFETADPPRALSGQVNPLPMSMISVTLSYYGLVP